MSRDLLDIASTPVIARGWLTSKRRIRRTLGCWVGSARSTTRSNKKTCATRSAFPPAPRAPPDLRTARRKDVGRTGAAPCRRQERKRAGPASDKFNISPRRADVGRRMPRGRARCDLRCNATSTSNPTDLSILGLEARVPFPNGHELAAISTVHSETKGPEQSPKIACGLVARLPMTESASRLIGNCATPHAPAMMGR